MRGPRRAVRPPWGIAISDILNPYTGQYEPEFVIERKAGHVPSLVGSFSTRAVCRGCGAIASWDPTRKVWADANARDWMATDAYVAWLTAPGDDDLPMPPGVHLWPLSYLDDHDADGNPVWRPDPAWLAERAADRAHMSAMDAERRAWRERRATGRPAAVAGYKHSEGRKERKARYRRRHRAELAAKERARRAAAKAAAAGEQG